MRRLSLILPNVSADANSVPLCLSQELWETLRADHPLLSLNTSGTAFRGMISFMKCVR